MKNYLFILIILISISSCRKEIDINLPNNEESIVVQGAIEQGFPPYVILTRNQGYFDPIDNNTFNNLFIDNAKVVVWKKNLDGTVDSVFLERLPAPFDSIPIYTDIDYLNSSIGSPYTFSEEGGIYHLIVRWNNKTITSTTTIPYSTPLDSIWIEETENTNDTHFRCDIKSIYNDPDTSGNNILIRSKREEHWIMDTLSDIYPANNIIQNNDPLLLLVDCGPDILINGEAFETYFPRPSGQGGFPTGTYNSGRYKKYKDTTTSGKDSVYIPNDIVILKFCQVDETSMRFWRGVVRNVTSGGNPFAEPMNLNSNINGGLGIWSGYGSTYYKIPVVKDTVIYEKYVPNIFEIF